MHKSDAETKRAAMKRFFEWYGVSAAEACRRAGITHSTLYGFLNGQSDDIYYGTLEKLAKGLGVTVAQIMGEVRLPVPGDMKDSANQGFEPMPGYLANLVQMLPPEDAELLNAVKKLTPEEKKMLSRMSKGLHEEGSDGKQKPKKRKEG